MVIMDQEVDMLFMYSEYYVWEASTLQVNMPDI